MDFIDLIRNADSAPEVLSALAVFLRSLPAAAVIPDWCLRLPIEGEEDVVRRMVALFGVVNLTSRHLLDRECDIAKRALRAFAAAAHRLRRH